MYDPKEYTEVPLAKLSVSRKETSKPGQVSIDIAFANNSGNDFDVLVFQNFYTSSISIIQQASGGFVSILDNYYLMDSPYCLRKSQNWFAINTSEFSSSFIRGKPMRIILFQPATQWHKFELRNIKLLCKTVDMSSSSKGSMSSNNCNNTQQQSISDMIWSDYKLLKEACQEQINCRHIDHDFTSYVSVSEKKSSKKKERRSTSRDPAVKRGQSSQQQNLSAGAVSTTSGSTAGQATGMVNSSSSGNLVASRDVSPPTV